MEGREKENEVAKIMIKSHTFLIHPLMTSEVIHQYKLLRLHNVSIPLNSY